jgi:hypothetical protein
MDSARKAYSQYSGEEEATRPIYNERRFFISQRLPNMLGYELQNCINPLNEDLEDLKAEIQEIEVAIRLVREGKDPEAARHEYKVLWSLHDGPKDVIEKFKSEIEWRRKVAKWVRRERQIYLWEKTRRKMASAKLPLLHQQLKGLNQEALGLLCQMKAASEQLARLCESHRKVCSMYSGLKSELEKLSFEREDTPKDKMWTGFSAPDPNEALKSFRFLKDLELEEKSKEESKGLRKLFKHRKEAE